MAQMKYEDFVKFSEQQSKERKENSTKNYVGYFALKEDNEACIVRFNIGSLDDITVVSKHTVKNKEGKARIISCLRSDPTQPLDDCPLCAAGEKVAFRAYIPLVYYSQDEENNTTTPVAALWEQAPKIRDTLKTFLDDYGDLRDYLFKIVRHGKKGDTGTTYTILPANAKIYTEEVFKKDFSGFDHLDFERFVATKTADEMNQFLEEGEFPFKKTNNQQVAENKETAATRPAPVTNTTAATPEQEAPSEEEVPPTRPRRIYTY